MNNMLDESFLRPPLWEDITSSIQNIDPENAIMLGTTATHVKLESCDTDQFIEPLSTSPLLSPLEIKPELKQQYLHTQMHTTQSPLQVIQTHHLHNHQPMQISHPIHLSSNGKRDCSKTKTSNFNFTDLYPIELFHCFSISLSFWHLLS